MPTSPGKNLLTVEVVGTEWAIGRLIHIYSTIDPLGLGVVGREREFMIYRVTQTSRLTRVYPSTAVMADQERSENYG